MILNNLPGSERSYDDFVFFLQSVIEARILNPMDYVKVRKLWEKTFVRRLKPVLQPDLLVKKKKRNIKLYI